MKLYRFHINAKRGTIYAANRKHARVRLARALGVPAALLAKQPMHPVSRREVRHG